METRNVAFENLPLGNGSIALSSKDSWLTDYRGRNWNWTVPGKDLTTYLMLKCGQLRKQVPHIISRSSPWSELEDN